MSEGAGIASPVPPPRPVGPCACTCTCAHVRAEMGGDGKRGVARVIDCCCFCCCCCCCGGGGGSGQGIGPHQDGPLYAPRAAILSLAGPAALRFWASRPAPPGAGAGPPAPAAGAVVCGPGSLVVVCGRAYADYWHGIAAEAEVSAGRARAARAARGACRVSVRR